MATYRLGSQGEEVSKIQTRLKELGYYRGPIDGDFGGGTASAVKSFQQAKGSAIDGIVGPATWKALFPQEELPTSSLLQQPAAYRCLALTGSFETNAAPPDCFAGVSGDFDGQGMSLGVCQWNIGQGSLQPLFTQMDRDHLDEMKQIFHDDYPMFSAWLQAEREEQLDWIRQHQDPVKHVLFEPWRGYFKRLGRSEAFQQIQAQAAQALFNRGVALCKKYAVTSERGAALLFDILVQNGSIGTITEAQILRDFATVDSGLSPEAQEVERMKIIANRRADAAKPEWREDVRARKLTIAQGEGVVHGRSYQLEEQFGLGLAPYRESRQSPRVELRRGIGRTSQGKRGSRRTKSRL